MLTLGMKLFTDTPLVVIGMILFLFAYFCVFIRTYFRARSKEYYQEIANLPLGDGNEEK